MIGPTKLCPQGIGLALFDLDDTILTNGVTVSARVLDTITLARERGCMACVSSGRSLNMVPEILQKPQAMDYLICSNGACIYDTFGDVLYEKVLTREQVLAAIDALAYLEPGWNAFIGDRSYFEWRCISYVATGKRQLSDTSDMRGRLHSGAALHLRGLSSKARKALGLARRVLFDTENKKQVRDVRPVVEATEEKISKVGCSLPSAEACERAMAILEHMGDYQVVRVRGTELEITAKGVTKGTAAQWLMEYLDVDPACTVAFGDSENDAPLADVCGTFVAMEDGDSRIRDIADDVCESVYDDGVARWFERAMAEADGAKHV